MICTVPTPETPESLIVYVNRAFSDATGYSANEVLGRSPSFLRGPNTDLSELAALQAAISAGLPYRAERLNYRKDGSQLWADIEYRPLVNAEGVVSHWLAVSRDMVTRSLALATLRQSEQMFRQLFEDNPIPMWVMDRASARIIEVNDAAVADYGWSREACLSMTAFDLRRSEYKEAISRYQQGPEYPRRKSGPWDVLRADGSEIKVMTFMGAVNYLGRPALLRAAWDVTEMEEARAALRERTAELTDAQRLANLADWRVDVRSGQVTWSDELFTMLGLKPGSFTPDRHSFLGRVHPDDRAEMSAAVAAMYATKGSYTAEFRTGAIAGKSRYIVSQGRCIVGADGELDAVHGLCQDVTERRMMEQQLAQAQKMEAIGNLTGGMAHDFNNLLSVIVLSLECLRDAREGDGDRELAELTGNALAAAISGADLTHRLLAFARQQPLRPRRIEVNALVAHIVQLITRTLGENIEVSLALEGDVWAIVADPAQLEASLVNLANNSRDAMPSGGRISIATANQVLDTDYAAQHAEVVAGDYVLIAVSDTGTGMSPEVANQVFEPFFTTKERDQGTGLGLAMVFGFVRQSGGHISVYSELGAGTTFRIYLPRAPASAAPTLAPPIPALTRGAGQTILIVEDNIPLRQVVMRQITGLGYRALEATDAQNALALLGREDVDMLLTDVVMPGGINGTELARRARQLCPTLKVVFTSGFSEIQVSGEGRALPPEARLLTKPYSRRDLSDTIREALSGG